MGEDPKFYQLPDVGSQKAELEKELTELQRQWQSGESEMREMVGEPSAAALSLQDCIGSLLRKFITGIRTGNHSCLSLTEVSGNAFYEMIRIRTEAIAVTVNICCRGNLKVTAESIDLVKIQLTCYRELGKSFFTGSRIASRKRILSLELGISADREST